MGTSIERDTKEDTGDEAGRIPDPSEWVERYGDFLFRFALHRVGEATLAEDLTQDTFMAALERADSFRGRSTPRTWFVSILRHKIADHFRRCGAGRETARERTLGERTEALFDKRGIWCDKPKSWSKASSEPSEELSAALVECLTRLPPQVAELFVLTEQHEVPAEHLAPRVGLSKNALWVRLYRARVALRECLDRNWFRGEAS